MRQIQRNMITTSKLDIEDLFPKFGAESFVEKLKGKMHEQRQLTIDTAIDSSIMPLVYQIEQWNREDDESEQVLKEFERQTITMFISSPGGEVTAGMSLISAMQQSVTPIMTICTGMAASMGFLIFISGHMRYSYRNAEFMLHQLSHATWGKLQDMYESVLWDLQVQNRIDKIVTDCTKITQEKLDENRKCKIDWYFYPDEAATLGIIDGMMAVGLTITREEAKEGEEEKADDTPTKLGGEDTSDLPEPDMIDEALEADSVKLEPSEDVVGLFVPVEYEDENPVPKKKRTRLRNRGRSLEGEDID